MFETGKVYKRRALHDLYGGQWQGGISTPAKTTAIFIFTGASGARYGYKDHWKGDSFYYTGEGQIGDMQFTKGNLAIRDHMQTDKSIYLFEGLSKGNAKYICQLKYVGHSIEDGVDRDNRPRKLIVFQLQRV